MNHEPVRVEHDWIAYAEDGAVTNGYGPAFFNDDLLLPCDYDRFGRILHPFTVARAVYSRARMYPAWAWALCEHLWNDAPEPGIREALEWASKMREPKSYAAALVVVYLERSQNRRAASLQMDALALRRLLLQSMRDLGDASAPDEVPNC